MTKEPHEASPHGAARSSGRTSWYDSRHPLRLDKRRGRRGLDCRGVRHGGKHRTRLAESVLCSIIYFFRLKMPTIAANPKQRAITTGVHINQKVEMNWAKASLASWFGGSLTEKARMSAVSMFTS